MYKILNWLFGWDYILWSNSWACLDELAGGVSRLHRDIEGNLWYHVKGEGWSGIRVVEKPSHVLWLTCSPSKYFELENQQDE